MSERNDEDLKRTEELFAFLQGEIPKGYKIARTHRPKLTPDQAWTVIWYLGNQYREVPDSVQRCDVCGDLYHTHQGGDCLDFGKRPYHFCDGCLSSDDYARKSAEKGNK